MIDFYNVSMVCKKLHNCCCNPLNLKNHTKFKGLWSASIFLRNKWKLKLGDYLCTQYRIRMGKEDSSQLNFKYFA